jgi:hypothetical protein
MGARKLDTVVQDIYSKTYQLWEATRSQLAQCNDHGFKILYGPPRFQIPVLVIGVQPGGDASNVKDAELRQPSITNEYLSESWPLAVELRRRLGSVYLQDAVGTNAIFFRAPTWAQWQTIDRGLRLQLETFSLDQTKRLISAMQPKQILLLGWDALDLMGGRGFQELVANRPRSAGPRRKRLLQSGKIEGIPAFAIPHPSAAWKNPPVTEEDWQMIAGGLGATGQLHFQANRA